MRVQARWLLFCLLWSVVATIVPAHAWAHGCGVVTIPSSFVDERAFAVPVAAADQRKLRFWVDSDGSGFIFDDLARHYGTLAQTGQKGNVQASLPRFAADASIPALTSHAGALGVLDRADVSGDPIFEGLAGQLGASWLQQRVWTFDYRRAVLRWRCDGSEPTHDASEEIALSFSRDESGRLTGGRQYPQLQVLIAGESMLASLDTAATVVLSRAGMASLGGSDAVRATSFVTRKLIARWHSRHPSWSYIDDAGKERGIAAILAPLVMAGQVRFTDVWFTTRPGDDVFGSEKEQIKLGPSAFGCCVLTIDYPRRRAIVQKR